MYRDPELPTAIEIGKRLGTQEASVLVHHIDSDPTNNDLDNLALVTNAGHIRVHFLQKQRPELLRLKDMRILEAVEYLTSRSNKTTAI
jgi:hypothetical protein